MKLRMTSLMAATLLLAYFGNAQAHTAFVVDINSIPFANKTYFATLNASHGCEDAAGVHYDTEIVEVDIPTEASANVRPMDAAWGTAEVITDETTGAVTMLRWTRTAAAHADDTFLYRVNFSIRLPDAPFTTLEFLTRQICNGQTLTTTWEGAEVPKLNLVPAGIPGWNKYTAQSDIDAMAISTFFSKAIIVWHNNAAYTSNPNVAPLINNTLTNIPAGGDYWVKY